MKDWTGIPVIVLAFVFFTVHGLLKDNDPGHTNPRREIAKERKYWMDFQRNTLIVIALSFIGSYLFVRFVKWI